MAYYKYVITYDNNSYSGTLDGSIPILYNGDHSITSNKTIKCGNKIMQTNLSVGAKKMKCKDKIMKGNVQVDVSKVDITSVLDNYSSGGYWKITVKWKVNTPSQYSGVRICMKSGSFPTGVDDSVVYTGAGSGTGNNCYYYEKTGLNDDCLYYISVYPYVLSNSLYCWGTPANIKSWTSCYYYCSCDNDCYSCTCDGLCKCDSACSCNSLTCYGPGCNPYH